MMEAIIPALISGAVTLTVCMVNNASQQKKTEAQHNTTIALIEYKLDQLDHKVELHNNAVERLYAVEKKVAVYDEKFRVANHRIEDLEHMEKAGE